MLLAIGRATLHLIQYGRPLGQLQWPVAVLHFKFFIAACSCCDRGSDRKHSTAEHSFVISRLGYQTRPLSSPCPFPLPLRISPLPKDNWRFALHFAAPGRRCQAGISLSSSPPPPSSSPSGADPGNRTHGKQPRPPTPFWGKRLSITGANLHRRRPPPPPLHPRSRQAAPRAADAAPRPSSDHHPHPPLQAVLTVLVLPLPLCCCCCCC